jgi:hypothetical protein
MAALNTQKKYVPNNNTDVIPKDYVELFQMYYEYIRKLVYRSGIDSQNVENVTMAVIIRLLEKDALAQYDPDFGVKNETHQALFRTFLSSFVISYLKHPVDMQRKLSRREGLSLDKPTGSDNDGREQTVYDMLAPAHEDSHEDLEYTDLVGQIRRQVASSTKKNGIDRCDMPAFFEAILEQQAQQGSINVKELAEKFKVGKSTIQNWIKRLRSEVAPLREV